ncbi:MAG TPA: poly-gamma-glutamate hydrolase family protein [Steroidobacteraceae bacterium]|nr:poly-gamma-glutamate hydrolase family protein [Steroidobacteraceae bacterium]
MAVIIRGKANAAVPDAAGYRGYADLARSQRRGRDYAIIVRRRRESRIAVIAPHGGDIEDGTSAIARAIAGDDLNLYLFEGRRRADNYRALHLTSHRFDEPLCLDLLARCDAVVAVHGCAGRERRLFLGGLDHGLRDWLAAALRAAGMRADTRGHRFAAVHPENICNRGTTRMGVQIELTQPLRRGTAAMRVAAAVRCALLAGAPCYRTSDQLLCGTSR